MKPDVLDSSIERGLRDRSGNRRVRNDHGGVDWTWHRGDGGKAGVAFQFIGIRIDGYRFVSSSQKALEDRVGGSAARTRDSGDDDAPAFKEGGN